MARYVLWFIHCTDSNPPEDLKSTKADPDVCIWLRKATKDNGFENEMLFVYVDDILALSHRAKNAIEEITEFYKAKGGVSSHTGDLFGRKHLQNAAPGQTGSMDDIAARVRQEFAPRC
jgi:hypothetical protein